MPHKPRPAVIDQLATDALSAMENSNIPDMTSAEVMSASFTITKRIIKIMINPPEKADREHNIDAITNAIADLYAIIPQRTVN